jgi:hypothetical protein
VLGGSKVEGQMLIGYESGYMPTRDSQSNSKKQFWYITTVLKTYGKVKELAKALPVLCQFFHENRQSLKGFEITETPCSLILIFFQRTSTGFFFILVYLKNQNLQFKFLLCSCYGGHSYWNFATLGQGRLFLNRHHL